jgi:hypothetical protein
MLTKTSSKKPIINWLNSTTQIRILGLKPKTNSQKSISKPLLICSVPMKFCRIIIKDKCTIRLVPLIPRDFRVSREVSTQKTCSEVLGETNEEVKESIFRIFLEICLEDRIEAEEVEVMLRSVKT